MDKYSFRVSWSDRDEGYIAVCPEFPKLSAFGESADEALKELRVVLEMAIETYQEEGWSLPAPRKHELYSGQFRVRLPRGLHAELSERAEIEEVSLNTLVVRFLAEAAGYGAAVTDTERESITLLRQMQKVLLQLRTDLVRSAPPETQNWSGVQDRAAGSD